MSQYVSAVCGRMHVPEAGPLQCRQWAFAAPCWQAPCGWPPLVGRQVLAAAQSLPGPRSASLNSGAAAGPDSAARHAAHISTRVAKDRIRSAAGCEATIRSLSAHSWLQQCWARAGGLQGASEGTSEEKLHRCQPLHPSGWASSSALFAFGAAAPLPGAGSGTASSTSFSEPERILPKVPSNSLHRDGHFTSSSR